MVNLKVKEGASRSPDSQGEVPLREDHSEETLIRKYSFTSGFKDPVSEFNEFKPCLKSPKNRFQLSAWLKS